MGVGGWDLQRRSGCHRRERQSLSQASSLLTTRLPTPPKPPPLPNKTKTKRSDRAARARLRLLPARRVPHAPRVARVARRRGLLAERDPRPLAAGGGMRAAVVEQLEQRHTLHTHSSSTQHFIFYAFHHPQQPHSSSSSRSGSYLNDPPISFTLPAHRPSAAQARARASS